MPFARAPERNWTVGRALRTRSSPSHGSSPVLAHENLEIGRPGVVDDRIPYGVDKRKDGQSVTGAHAHPPKGLLPVADGLVYELHVRHGEPSARRVGSSSSSSQRVWWRLRRKSLLPMTSVRSPRFVVGPADDEFLEKPLHPGHSVVAVVALDQ